MTTATRPAPTAEQFIGGYGTDWRPGVLSEHADQFIAAGGTIRTSASGARAWAVADGGRAVPVVCSDLIRIDTEDGPAAGRCGIPAEAHGSCDRHGAERDAWLASSEGERAAWERAHDDLDEGGWW